MKQETILMVLTYETSAGNPTAFPIQVEKNNSCSYAQHDQMQEIVTKADEEWCLTSELQETHERLDRYILLKLEEAGYKMTFPEYFSLEAS